MNIRIIKQYNTKGFDADADVFYNILNNITPKNNIMISTENEVIRLKPKDDVHIYISYANIKIMDYCRIKMFMINHELFLHRESDLEGIRKVDYLLAKNHIGVNWAQKIKDKYQLKYKIVLTKFTSLFPVIKVDKIWNLVLHSAGEHHWKQTDSILKCWLKYPDMPIIVITCTDQCYKNIQDLIGNSNPKNLIFHNSLLPKDEFIKLKNEAGMHLCPSIVEGFGHYINEGRKVGSLVITSNMAPMNELINTNTGVLINCDEIAKKRNGADLCIIDEDSIYETVKLVINIPFEKKLQMAKNGHDEFAKDTLFFENAMRELIKQIG